MPRHIVSNEFYPNMCPSCGKDALWFGIDLKGNDLEHCKICGYKKDIKETDKKE